MLHDMSDATNFLWYIYESGFDFMGYEAKWSLLVCLTKLCNSSTPFKTLMCARFVWWSMVLVSEWFSRQEASCYVLLVWCYYYAECSRLKINVVSVVMKASLCLAWVVCWLITPLAIFNIASWLLAKGSALAAGCPTFVFSPWASRELIHFHSDTSV